MVEMNRVINFNQQQGLFTLSLVQGFYMMKGLILLDYIRHNNNSSWAVVTMTLP